MTRSDTDTWDLANSVGITATTCAAARAIATRSPDPIICDHLAEPLARAVGIDFLNRWMAGELTDADIDVDEPGVRLPNMPDQLAKRTRFFDDFFGNAAAAGSRQAVILASGLDTRAYRLDWAPGTVVYEIDQPQVLDFKAATLKRLDAQPKAGLHHVPIDLRGDWPAVLRNAGFDAAAPTAWSAEGLLYYLPGDARDRLLDNITALSAIGSRLAADIAIGSPVSADQTERLRKAAAKWHQLGFPLDIESLQYQAEDHDYVAHLDALGWQTQTASPDPEYAGAQLCTSTFTGQG